MIAIDTNVLLRYLLQDDEEQAAKASKIILGSERVLITDVVLTETVWTLKGKRYNLTKKLKQSKLNLNHNGTVGNAPEYYQFQGRGLDFQLFVRKLQRIHRNINLLVALQSSLTHKNISVLSLL